MMSPSTCQPWQTDATGQTAGERNEVARSYTSPWGTIQIKMPPGRVPPPSVAARRTPTTRESRDKTWSKRSLLVGGRDSRMIRLLGIDPGLRVTGWGLIEVDGNRLIHIADGVIATDHTCSVPARLKTLHDALMALLTLHRPSE